MSNRTDDDDDKEERRNDGENPDAGSVENPEGENGDSSNKESGRAIPMTRMIVLVCHRHPGREKFRTPVTGVTFRLWTWPVTKRWKHR